MASRTPPRHFVFIAFAGIAAALVLYFGAGIAKATAASAAVLEFPTASCGASTNVTFKWQPADEASEVWLDLANEENGFAPGTFQAFGPYGGTTSTITLNSLRPDRAYVGRINSRTPAGWQASTSVAFVPCGAPQLLSYTSTCAGDAAFASFRWAPSSPPVAQQSIEAGFDQSFGNANTRSSGPLLAMVGQYDMSGLRANVTNYFRISSTLPDGTSRRSQVMSFSTACVTAFSNTVSDELFRTSDTLVYPRLNIRAPVNLRKVGYDGGMGLPEGKDDVVLYDFSVYRNLGGSPGMGGTSILAGHLDYRPNFQGVFWDLAKARVGDVIEYYRGDGVKLSYQVTWASLIPSDEPLNQYFVSTNPETIMLITCEGNFDRNLRNYDKRALVYAVAINN